MKCQKQANQKSEILKAVFFAGLLFCAICSSGKTFAKHNLDSVPNLDSVRAKIMNAMQTVGNDDDARKAKAKALKAYEKCKKNFYNLIAEFLSTHNKKSCTEHVKNFQDEIDTFEANLVNHPELADLRPILTQLHKDLNALVEVLRRYSDPKDSAKVLNFLSEIQNFAHLLPSDIKQQYNFAKLLGAVRHRLSIKA